MEGGSMCVCVYSALWNSDEMSRDKSYACILDVSDLRFGRSSAYQGCTRDDEDDDCR